MRSWLVGMAFWGTAGGISLAGVCTYDYSTPGVPRASCHSPACPPGIECAPTIVKESALLVYQEPKFQMSSDCPAYVLRPCWSVTVPFTFRLSAQAKNGIKDIGIHAAFETAGRREFQYVWGDAGTADASGRFSLAGTLRGAVALGHPFELSVIEICARTRSGDEGCVLPLRIGNWSMGAEPPRRRYVAKDPAADAP